MFEASQYELLDFGAGRKLERFGSYVLDRPSPAAAYAVQSRPELWHTADARFERVSGGSGQWFLGDLMPDQWSVPYRQLVFVLKTTDSGHVGLFPEQAENWDWLSEQ